MSVDAETPAEQKEKKEKGSNQNNQMILFYLEYGSVLERAHRRVFGKRVSVVALIWKRPSAPRLQLRAISLFIYM